MNIKLLTLITTISLSLVACGGGGDGGGSSVTPPPSTGNTLHIQITPGSNVCNYFNAPCASVTICQEGTNTCDTINNILVDTGSYGLRVFGSLLPNTANSLPQMTTSGGTPIAECVKYADGTSDWGPVKYANVTLGSLTTTSQIPIQIIDANFTGADDNCEGATTSPEDFGVNGILGVGPLPTDARFGHYFACSGSSCSSTIIPPAFVTNPITQFGQDNNGMTLSFAAVPSNGASSADGYATFGIGTNLANTPASGASYNIFKIDNNLSTNFNGSTYPTYLDTGSQALYFPNSFLKLCTGSTAGYFCPSSSTAETATMIGTNGLGTSSSATINFNINNADDLLDNGSVAFSNIGAYIPGIGAIDWGMPFYYGRTVYMVFAGSTATINGVNLPASPNGYWIY